MKRFSARLSSLLVLITFVGMQTAMCAEIEQLRELTFGRVAIINNDQIGTYAIDRRGRYSTSPGLAVVELGEPGIFQVSGLTRFEIRSVSVIMENSQLSSQGIGSETFSLAITDYDETIQANAAGEATVRYGGTLSTSGSSSRDFSTVIYSGIVRVTLNL